MIYWKPRHQALVEEWYYAQYSGITSGDTRNRCITELYPVFEYMITKNCRMLKIPLDDDRMQDAIIKISYHFLPRLNRDKLQGALQFLWISIRRYMINRNQLKKHYYDPIEDDIDVADSRTNEADHPITIEDHRREIMDMIDQKIEEQRKINKNNTILLINMKEYLNENNYDPRGFDKYVQQKMGIQRTTYNSIMSRLRIKSKVFNEKIIK